MQLIPIEQYLEKRQPLTEEQTAEITRARSLEHMLYDQYKALVKMKFLIPVLKLKKPRSLFVDNEKIIYFNSFHKQFHTVAFFSGESQELQAIVDSKKEQRKLRKEAAATAQYQKLKKLDGFLDENKIHEQYIEDMIQDVFHSNRLARTALRNIRKYCNQMIINLLPQTAPYFNTILEICDEEI